MRLHKIILQLSENDYSLFSNQLKENKADKFHLLLTSYRDTTVSEANLLKKLDMKPAAFYTLKSRLFDKIQEFLYKNTSDTRVELLQNVANIEHLVYKTPRETAIGILQKLEIELIENDMPNELINVYKALKKLHIHSQKYYDYLQLYNKHVAFNLAQDKAEELLSLFCKTQGEYFLNRNDEALELLVLYKKEIANICRLYQSHHLKIFKNIILIHFALFTPVQEEMKSDATVEDMLKESTDIIEAHPEDRTYKHLIHIINFLYFEYYHQLKLHKNATKYFEMLPHTEELLLFSHCSFVYHFLISKIEYFQTDYKESNLHFEDEVNEHEPNQDDIPGCILFNTYKATAEYYTGNYTESIQILNDLLNEISFKRMPYPEVEIKSFLAFLYILNKNSNLADIHIRSVSRKIIDENNDTKYNCASAFLKFLKTGTSIKKTGKQEKLIQLYDYFNAINQGKYNFIPYLKLDEKVIALIAK